MLSIVNTTDNMVYSVDTLNYYYDFLRKWTCYLKYWTVKVRVRPCEGALSMHQAYSGMTLALMEHYVTLKFT